MIRQCTMVISLNTQLPPLQQLTDHFQNQLELRHLRSEARRHCPGLWKNCAPPDGHAIRGRGVGDLRYKEKHDGYTFCVWWVQTENGRYPRIRRPSRSSARGKGSLRCVALAYHLAELLGSLINTPAFDLNTNSSGGQSISTAPTRSVV